MQPRRELPGQRRLAPLEGGSTRPGSSDSAYGGISCTRHSPVRSSGVTREAPAVHRAPAAKIIAALRSRVRDHRWLSPKGHEQDDEGQDQGAEIPYGSLAHGRFSFQVSAITCGCRLRFVLNSVTMTIGKPRRTCPYSGAGSSPAPVSRSLGAEVIPPGGLTAAEAHGSPGPADLERGLAMGHGPDYPADQFSSSEESTPQALSAGLDAAQL